MVSGGDRKGDQLTFPEHRLDDEDVRDVHAAIEGVVHDEDVAGLHLLVILGEKGLHRFGDGTQMHGDGHALSDHLTVGVAERGGVIEAIPHDRRVGGPVQGRRHFVGGGSQRILRQFARDGVDARCHFG